MTEFTTSAVYDVWDVLTARMRNVSWPAPPDGTQDNVAVWFGDPRQPNVDEHGNPPNATECVVVVSMVETPDTEWGAIGQLARDEQFRIPVFVETLLQGRDSADWEYAKCFTKQVRAVPNENAVDVEVTLTGMPESLSGSFSGMLVIQTGYEGKPELKLPITGVCRGGAVGAPAAGGTPAGGTPIGGTPVSQPPK